MIERKNKKSKECMICNYWFFNHGFKFQDSAYNGCHDLTVLCFNISDIAIITVKNVDYRCIIHNSKSEAINLLKSAGLKNHGYIYKNIVLIFQSIQDSFFSLSLIRIYKIVDIMNIFKSLNINIGTVMRNQEMLKFVPNHLKTKKNAKASN